MGGSLGDMGAGDIWRVKEEATQGGQEDTTQGGHSTGGNRAQYRGLGRYSTGVTGQSSVSYPCIAHSLNTGRASAPYTAHTGAEIPLQLQCARGIASYWLQFRPVKFHGRNGN